MQVTTNYHKNINEKIYINDIALWYFEYKLDFDLRVKTTTSISN